MVYDINEVVSQTTKPKVASSAPVNLFGYSRVLASPSDEFVSLNNDTLYTFAHCDVRGEPLVLNLPDTNGRYYVMQFVDAWTNNFAYVGRRASGTSGGLYLLTAADWDGTVPLGMEVVRAPTSVFSIIGRHAVEGTPDVPNVIALQDQTWLTPLSRYPDRVNPESRRFGDHEVAAWNTNVPEGLRFWEQLRAWSQLFPPAPDDQRYLETFAPLGLLETESPYINPDPALSAVLIEGANDGLQVIEEIMRKGAAAPINGWLSAAHSFDYNLDHFGPGTIDAPEWKLPNREESYVVRAASAMGGLWGNHGYEAVYCYSYVDDQGELLTGGRRYSLHFDETPPVGAFWSMTMYDLPKYYLVDNPIDRYAIGSLTPDVQRNSDGSLDIFIQVDNPGAGKQSNWLPTPSGAFRPIMRMYQPGAAILDGTYQLPPIRRLFD
jgi:hypothetical protein